MSVLTGSESCTMLIVSTGTRLDELFAGIKGYLGGKLTLAPLDNYPVSSILEIG